MKFSCDDSYRAVTTLESVYARPIYNFRSSGAKSILACGPTSDPNHRWRLAEKPEC